MIGIVSHTGDVHAQSVRRHLDGLGAEHLLIDTARFPTQVALTTDQEPGGRWRAVWADGGESRDLSDVRVMWWRRPQPFRLHDEVTDPQDRGFAHGECAAVVRGLWSCLAAEWINDPDRDEAGSRKMWQLQLASQLGLRVPRTCMTNSPDRAREFVSAEPSGAIFKPFSATPKTWRETRPVRACDVELMDHVRFAPVIFQELIPGGIDVRVTIVGDQVFPAEIRAGESGYEFDFRIDTAHAPMSVHPLPKEVEDRLLRLMRRLGLWYGAIDLRLAPNGDYVFLEINPAGQWLFIELATGQQITAALAGLMVRLDGSDRSRDRAAPRVLATIPSPSSAQTYLAHV